MPHDGTVTWAAVILTGGRAQRLGGTDKASLEHQGLTLLGHALAAVAGAAETVVVGPEVMTPRPVTFARESPPGGGPLAGLAAGVAALEGEHEWVVVLAVDKSTGAATTQEAPGAITDAFIAGTEPGGTIRTQP